MALRNVLFLIVCAVCFLGMMFCGESKYADAKAVTVKYLDAMENFASAVEKASNPEALVSAVDEFEMEMKKLRPEMEAVERKYPELTDTETPPAEMEDLAHRMNTLSQRLLAVQTKLMKYAADPDVQGALQKLQNIK